MDGVPQMIGQMLAQMLGQGLEPTQRRTMAYTALFFGAMNVGVCRGFGAGFPQMEKRDIRRVALHATTGVFSLLICALGCSVLLFPDEALVQDRIYGYSPRAQTTFGIMTGFFFFELATIFANREDLFDWGSVFHGVGVILIYLFCQYPFLHWWASVCLMYELSTPFLKTWKILALVRPSSTKIIRICRLCFAILFSVVRVFMGIPISFKFWADMLQLLAEGREHSRAMVVFFLIINVSLNGLNILWFFKILSTVAKAFGSKAKMKN